MCRYFRTLWTMHDEAPRFPDVHFLCLSCPLFTGLQGILSANQPGAETAPPAPASGRGNRGWHSFHLLAVVLVVLLAATPAKADGFTIFYNGTLTQITPASDTYSLPLGIALDLSGNLYIAGSGNNRILKASAGSTTAELFTITIGGETATFNIPEQLAVDSAGNLYIAGTSNNRIVKSDPSGNGTVLSTGAFTLNGPIGVAVDTSGDVFISDMGNHRIVEIPSGGSATVLATTSGISLTTLSSPQGLATDTYGNLYIVDLVEFESSNNRVVEVSTSLAGSTITTEGTLDYPLAVTVGNNGIIYVTDYTDERGAVHDLQGDLYDLFENEINSEFGHPSAIATDSQRAFYLTDFVANKVQLFHQGSADFGHVTLGSSSTVETLNFDIDGDTTVTGAIYTAGTQNLDYTIAANSGTPCVTGSSGISCTVNVQFTPTSAGLRRGALVLSYTHISNSGSFTVPLFGIGDGPVAALSPGVASQLSTGSLTFPNAFTPFQTAYDGVGDIYATDFANNAVYGIPAGGGTATTVSIPAISPAPATLNGPTGLAIDDARNLFIADSGNNRIVEVTSAGNSNVVTACIAETVFPCTPYSFNNPQSLFIDGRET
jgi:sugar lactone lactonase YvrE